MYVLHFLRLSNISAKIKHPVLTGTPIREELLVGSAAAGHRFTGLSSIKPTILVMGGSTGAVALNEAFTQTLMHYLRSTILYISAERIRRTEDMTEPLAMFSMSILIRK